MWARGRRRGCRLLSGLPRNLTYSSALGAARPLEREPALVAGPVLSVCGMKGRHGALTRPLHPLPATHPKAAAPELPRDRRGGDGQPLQDSKFPPCVTHSGW